MSRSHDWVRIADAARATGIPARTIRWWAERRKIPFAQIGGPRTWLLVYLSALKRPGVNPIDTEEQPQRYAPLKMRLAWEEPIEPSRLADPMRHAAFAEAAR
jgi:hypothetical protein